MDQELVDGFRAALPDDPELTRVAEDHDGLFIDVAWPGGSVMKIQLTPGRVHYATLNAPATGIYPKMCAPECLPRFFYGRGFDHFTADPTDDESRRRLLRYGAWEPNTDPPDSKPHGSLIWWLTKGGAR